jgi:hypothetical protein
MHWSVLLWVSGIVSAFFLGYRMGWNRGLTTVTVKQVGETLKMLQSRREAMNISEKKGE